MMTLVERRKIVTGLPFPENRPLITLTWTGIDSGATRTSLDDSTY
jgi:hypothetical protein